ncbi:MAG: hypothetical protein IT374_22550 [Polyangiaceae bacterium]|nr:hypothetical protein [Polyangiaceae bacterium]
MSARALVVVAVALASCADESTLPSRAPRGFYTADGGLLGPGGATGSAGAPAKGGGTASAGTSQACAGDPDEGTFGVVVDAEEETRSGLIVEKGQRVAITASGTWCWGSSPGCSGPDGTPGRPLPSELPVMVEGAYLGQLSLRIGASTLAVGSARELFAPACGELVFFMNDRPGYTADNSGALKVTVELGD